MNQAQREQKVIAKTPAKERSRFAREAAERNPPWMKMTDGLSLAQAKALAEKLKSQDRKLRSLGTSGNYSSVEVRPTFQGPSGKQEYGVFVVMRTENPGKYAAAYMKTYRAAIAADDKFQAALVKEYGAGRAGAARYQFKHASAAVTSAGKHKREADEKMRKALDQMRVHGESVNPTAFDKCVASVEKKGSATSPRAVCAVAGRKKYGAKAFAAMAARGRRAKGNAQHLASLTQGKVRGEVFSAGKDAYRAVVKFGKQAEEQTLGSFKGAMSWLRLRMHELASNPIAAATLYTIDQMSGKKSLASKLEKLAHKRWNGRRNPEDAAAKLFEVFHGFESQEVLEYVQEEHVHEWLAGIGPLVSLVVNNEAGTKQMTLYSPDPANTDFDQWVQVGVTENGKQLEFVGGDQSIDLDRLMKEFGLTEDDVRDRMFIGNVVQITYRTRKTFELGGKEEVDFFHDHGEEDAKGVLPKLVYKPLNPSIEFVGGRYKIAAPERGLDGVSPGIVG